MSSLHLYQCVRQALHQCGMRLPQPQLTNLALLCQALALSADCHLASLALQLPVRGQRQHNSYPAPDPTFLANNFTDRLILQRRNYGRLPCRTAQGGQDNERSRV